MAFALSFKAITWYKDSHSLFDYESTKITENNFDIALPENHIGIFRKKNCTSILIQQPASALPTNSKQSIWNSSIFFPILSSKIQKISTIIVSNFQTPEISKKRTRKKTSA